MVRFLPDCPLKFSSRIAIFNPVTSQVGWLFSRVGGAAGKRPAQVDTGRTCGAPGCRQQGDDCGPPSNLAYPGRVAGLGRMEAGGMEEDSASGERRGGHAGRERRLINLQWDCSQGLTGQALQWERALLQASVFPGWNSSGASECRAKSKK